MINQFLFLCLSIVVNIPHSFSNELLTTELKYDLKISIDSLKEPIQSFWFEPNDSPNRVGKFKRLEIGFKIPKHFTEEVNTFLSSGKSGINPFDPDQIDFRVILTDPKGAKSTRYAFFYQPFIEDLAKDVFSEDATDYPWRFRFAPPITGEWTVEIEVVILGKEIIVKSAMKFECVESNHKGTLLVSSTQKNADRWLKFSNSNEPFFAITNNISNGGFCGYVPSQSEAHLKGLEQLAEVEGNFTRIELGGQSALPDWPVYNNYKGKLDEMFAFDKMVDLCEDKNIYFTLFRHHVEVLDGGNPGQPNWDGVSWYENSYRQGFNLDSLETYFTDPTILKWQNKTLRYIFSRWGYSANMAFYSYSEVDRWYSKIFEDEEQQKVTGRKEIKDGGTLSEKDAIGMLAKWIEDQQLYIRKDLNSSMLFCHSYAVVSKLEYDKEFNGFFKLSDVVGLHNYGDIKDINYKKRYDQIEQCWEQFKKPVIMEEMGVNKVPILCCTGIEYHNNIWSTAMMGDFGTGMDWWWDRGVHDFGYHRDLKNIQMFFLGEDLIKGVFEPQKWDDVSSFNLNDFAVKRRLLENYALKSNDNERVLGWIHNASYYWRNLANDLPCIQNLVETNNPGQPCIVAKNPYFNSKNSNTINGCNASEYYDISTENHTEFGHERYKDFYTDKGGAKQIDNGSTIESNPTFNIVDLKKSKGSKKHWYKIEFYTTIGDKLEKLHAATQFVYTNGGGTLKPHVPDLNDENPDFAYKISYFGIFQKKESPKNLSKSQ